jgi:predicted nucleic acid-binding protein
VIAIDSSSFIAYFSGSAGSDVAAVEVALAEKQGCLPPAVLTELLSDPKLPKAVASLLRQLPFLTASDGYWERAGALRARVIASKHRAPLADTLIAQSCLDHDVPLITRDADFRPFERLTRLKLVR